MQKQMEANSAKVTEFNAVEKKLKQREKDVAQLK